MRMRLYSTFRVYYMWVYVFAEPKECTICGCIFLQQLDSGLYVGVCLCSTSRVYYMGFIESALYVGVSLCNT